jgi:hypothetical protein
LGKFAPDPGFHGGEVGGEGKVTEDLDHPPREVMAGALME